MYTGRYTPLIPSDEQVNCFSSLSPRLAQNTRVVDFVLSYESNERKEMNFISGQRQRRLLVQRETLMRHLLSALHAKQTRNYSHCQERETLKANSFSNRFHQIMIQRTIQQRSRGNVRKYLLNLVFAANIIPFLVSDLRCGTALSSRIVGKSYASKRGSHESSDARPRLYQHVSCAIQRITPHAYVYQPAPVHCVYTLT